MPSTLAEKRSANPAFCWSQTQVTQLPPRIERQPLPPPTRTAHERRERKPRKPRPVSVHPALHGHRPSSTRRPYAPPASASAMRVASRQRLPRAVHLGDPAPASPSPPPGPGASGAFGSGRGGGGVHGT